KFVFIASSDEEALGSKARKGGLGRKSNGRYKVIYNDYEQQIIHAEVKGPKVITEDRIYHPDFTKLCNLLKDEFDYLLSKDCPTEISDFGMLIGGHRASVYAMDLEFVDKSSKQCLEFLMKAATSGTPPAQRQLYVKSFRSP
ncbi:hypothetical protein BCV72DRAFT_311466, partial [Rhizopus microsporus var. microsporus]